MFEKRCGLKPGAKCLSACGNIMRPVSEFCLTTNMVVEDTRNK